MAFMVGELARLTGVTVRTLHHYDEIGLCGPSQRSAQGYRLYDDGDVLRLQQVLVLRELGLPLDEIAAVIDGEPDRAALLRRHRAALLEKRDKLDAMLGAVDAALGVLEGANAMQPEDVTKLFDGFDPAQHEAEARERWGESEAYRESARRTKGYSRADWGRYKAEAAAIGTKLAGFMRAGRPVNDAEVQAAVQEHRSLIDRWFYPCSAELHKALGAMYVADARFTTNLDQLGEGYARFLSDAIAAS
jgi:MerR family transcriptional regulator, thiopeptide resistance regulator